MDKIARIYHRLSERFNKRYHTLHDFKKRTGCKLSIETIRKHIYNKQPASAPILMLIAKNLDYTAAEIRQMLIDQHDTDYHPLLQADEQRETISTEERALIEAVRIIKKQAPAQLAAIADYLDLTALAIGADVAAHTIKLRAAKKTAHPRRKKIAWPDTR